VTLGSQISVTFVNAPRGTEEEGHEEEAHESAVDCEFELEADEVSEYPCQEGPSPIMPEVKELAWGGGAFVVLALVMRFALYPKLKKGMDARYAHIRDTRESADAARAAATAEVSAYESQLAAVKAEAAAKVDAARQTLEAERAAKLAEVNAEIGAKREAAAAEVRAARDAAGADIAAAVADVTGRTLELSIGKPADATAVQTAVSGVIGVKS
jgi:F-type H+-transporting ATPase subunit b